MFVHRGHFSEFVFEQMVETGDLRVSYIANASH